MPKYNPKSGSMSQFNPPSITTDRSKHSSGGLQVIRHLQVENLPQTYLILLHPHDPEKAKLLSSHLWSANQHPQLPMSWSGRSTTTCSQYLRDVCSSPYGTIHNFSTVGGAVHGFLKVGRHEGIEVEYIKLSGPWNLCSMSTIKSPSVTSVSPASCKTQPRRRPWVQPLVQHVHCIQPVEIPGAVFKQLGKSIGGFIGGGPF